MVHSLIKTQGRAREHLFLRYANPSISKIHYKLGHKHMHANSRCVLFPTLWVMSSIREKDILIISFTAKGMGAALKFQKGAGK